MKFLVALYYRLSRRATARKVRKPLRYTDKMIEEAVVRKWHLALRTFAPCKTLPPFERQFGEYKFFTLPILREMVGVDGVTCVRPLFAVSIVMGDNRLHPILSLHVVIEECAEVVVASNSMSRFDLLPREIRHEILCCVVTNRKKPVTTQMIITKN